MFFLRGQNGEKWGFGAISALKKTHLTCDLAKMLLMVVIVYKMGSNNDVASKMEHFFRRNLRFSFFPDFPSKIL